MVDKSVSALEGRCLLVVEDEFLIAADLVQMLEEAGAEVVGPAASVGQALDLISECDGQLDGAVLDVNLRGERVFPVADALASDGVPFIFATGYDVSAIPAEYANFSRCLKPVDPRQLARLLTQQKQGRP